jgi:hypothetical protein
LFHTVSKRPDDENADTEVWPTVEDARPAVAPGEPAIDGRNLRTVFAQQAIDLAEVFNLVVGAAQLAGPVQFRVELSAPEGQSTGGGTQSLQHVKLIPADGGATLVAGWMNQVERRAELRTLAYLDAQHGLRFQNAQLRAPPAPSQRLDRQRYEALLQRIEAFLRDQGIDARVADASEVNAAVPARRPAAGGASAIVWLLLAFVLAATVAALAVAKLKQSQ